MRANPGGTGRIRVGFFPKNCLFDTYGISLGVAHDIFEYVRVGSYQNIDCLTAICWISATLNVISSAYMANHIPAYSFSRVLG